VASDWPLSPNPPTTNPSNSRRAYFDWLTGSSTAPHVQFDTRTVLPYYLELALTGAFLENHCAGYGTDSTPNHLLMLGGQSPTLKDHSDGQAPVWDMPSVLGLAGDLWHNSPYDEHPPANVTEGMDTIWQAVDAVVQGGAWAETVFMLTWDDWGGYDDHVKTPALEYTPDNVQLALGPRVPLLMFGGAVKPGIDSRWCSHVSIPKTAMQLLGLPALGVPRLDDDPGLADLVDQDPSRPPNPPPPAYGAAIDLPLAPSPPIAPHPTPPAPPGNPVGVGPIILRGGSTLPPPNDAPLPRQPNPPGP